MTVVSSAYKQNFAKGAELSKSFIYIKNGIGLRMDP